jgi:hypothetical protein
VISFKTHLWLPVTYTCVYSFITTECHTLRCIPSVPLWHLYTFQKWSHGCKHSELNKFNTSLLLTFETHHLKTQRRRWISLRCFKLRLKPAFVPWHQSMESAWRTPTTITRNHAGKLPQQVLLKYLLIHSQGQDSLTSTKSRDSLWKEVWCYSTSKAPVTLQYADVNMETVCKHKKALEIKWTVAGRSAFWVWDESF